MYLLGIGSINKSIRFALDDGLQRNQDRLISSMLRMCKRIEQVIETNYAFERERMKRFKCRILFISMLHFSCDLVDTRDRKVRAMFFQSLHKSERFFAFRKMASGFVEFDEILD